MNQTVTVQTTSGPVTGLPGYRFLGIPYGETRRFLPARPVSWTAPKDCTRYGPQALQPNFLGRNREGLPFQAVGSEDCLNLNIWTPSIRADSRLPVVIYVHGGAFQTGFNNQPERSGDRFAGESPMVFVSVNYRLGVFGGLYLADRLGEDYRDSGSNSVLDVLLAVRWVKANAPAFGGDPERITMLGISAGAKCISALMLLPESRKLFSQVVLESGATQTLRTPAAAAELRERYLSYLPKASLRQQLSLPAETLLAAQAAFCDREGSVSFFGPILDGITFPEDWLERWSAGEAWKGRAVVGNGLHELCGLAQNASFLQNTSPVLENLFGGGAGAVENFQRASGLAWDKVLSDGVYRSAGDALARRLAQADNPVWVYSFDFPPAIHGMGFHFIMRQENAPFCRVSREDLPSARAVAAAMNRCVRDFICRGDPDPEGKLGWRAISPYGGEKLCFGKTLGLRPFPGDSLPGMPEYTYSPRT